MIPSLVYKMVFRFHAFIPKWCSCGAAGMLCSGTGEHVGLTSPHIWDISDNLIPADHNPAPRYAYKGVIS